MRWIRSRCDELLLLFLMTFLLTELHVNMEGASNVSSAMPPEHADMWSASWFEYTWTELICLSTVKYVLSILGVVGNASLILVVWKEKEFHTIGYYFMIQLAFSDMWATIFLATAMTISIVTTLVPATDVSYTSMEVMGFFYIVSFNLSVFTMTIISINRFCSVVYYNIYRDLFTARRFIIILVVIYVGSIIFTLPQTPQINLCNLAYYPKLWIFAVDYRPGRSLFSRLVFYFYMGMSIASVLVMSSCYLLIFLKLRQRLRVRGARAGHTESPKREDILLSVQFAIITCVFFVMWVVITFTNSSLGNGVDALLSKIMVSAQSILLSLTFSINPLIYMWMNKRLRAHVMPCLN